MTVKTKPKNKRGKLSHSFNFVTTIFKKAGIIKWLAEHEITQSDACRTMLNDYIAKNDIAIPSSLEEAESILEQYG